MRITHLPALLAAFCLTLITLSACQKESTATNNEVQQTTDICASLADEVAHAGVKEENKNTQLLAFFTPAEIADLRANTCLTREPASNDVEERASGLKGRYWTPGQTVRVRFLNGSTALQSKVMASARQWESYANIHFQQVTSGASEVRVLFGTDGHWSYVGTGNLSVDACEKTMSLELNDNTADAEIRRVVLHEFGHVLGMRHEHQQPLASIPWNKEKVYAYYAQQDWSKAEVDEQVLTKNSAETTQYTDFDRNSIMEYPVAASLTTNGYSIGWNTQLSAADKSFIGLMYSSSRIKIRHAASGYGNININLAGVYYTLKSGETVQAPALSSGNTLAVYEQPASGGAWVWDDAYAPVLGKNYKIVRSGSGGNLSLVAE